MTNDTCPLCDGCWPVSPSACDVPRMDVEMWLSRSLVMDRPAGNRRVAYLVVENRLGEQAQFKADYCPICGRRLVDDAE